METKIKIEISGDNEDPQGFCDWLIAKGYEVTIKEDGTGATINGVECSSIDSDYFRLWAEYDTFCKASHGEA